MIGVISACDGTAERLAQEAEICRKAVEHGVLEMAEAHCRLALGDADDDVLAPEVKSERLYRLAIIKRQLGKYAESAALLDESLLLEARLSGPDSAQAAVRRLEMALDRAGQRQWLEGAQLLERVVPVAGQLSEKEQAALGNILRQYIRQLQKMDRPEQAARLQAAADAIQQADEPGDKR